jgi:hypothetical protein
MFTRPAAVCAGLLLAVLATASALASGPSGGTGPGGSIGGGGGGGGGCSGVDCYANVWQYIYVTGNAADPAGGNAMPVPMPPPPCYMEPMFSGPELYALWKEERQGGGFPFPVYIPYIKKYKDVTAGYWWQRVTNLGVGGTCGLPLLAWVLPGAKPPLPQVPEMDLAIYAYDHMRLPSPALTLNPPDGRGYVSLPSYVWDNLAFDVGTVTAHLGQEHATVVARAGSLRLGVGQPGSAMVYDSGCTADGSTAPNPPKDAGPGTTPDCGVTFTAPGLGNSVTGTIRWKVTSDDGGFPAITTTGTQAVEVYEIQSLDNN